MTSPIYLGDGQGRRASVRSAVLVGTTDPAPSGGGGGGGAPSPGGTDGILSAGWDPNVDFGTTGDYFVATDGNDSNPGTVGSPFLTVGKAFSQLATDHPTASARAGRKIKIRGGDYHETLAPGANGGGVADNWVHVERYGTEDVRILGGDSVTGWTQCTSADAVATGPNWANCYKKTGFADTFFEWSVGAGGNAAGLPRIAGMVVCEDGSPMYIATLRQDMTLSTLPKQTVAETFFTGDSNTGNSVTDLDVVPTLVASELIADGMVRIKHSNNIVNTRDITGVAGSTITFGGGAATGDWSQRRYALANVANMTAGSFRYRLEGGTYTIYVWPANAANLSNGKLTISKRKFCVDWNCDWVSINGIQLLQPGGLNGISDHRCLEAAHGTNHQGVRLRHVRMAAADGSCCEQRPKLAGLQTVTNCDIRYLTCEDTLGCYGPGFDDSSNIRVFYYRARNLGQAPYRVLGARNMIVAWCDWDEVSLGQHANVWNCYGGSASLVYYSEHCWFHGIKARRANGYSVFKQTRRIAVTFCDLGPSTLAGNSNCLRSDGSVDRMPTSTPSDNRVIVFNNAGRPDYLESNMAISEAMAWAMTQGSYMAYRDGNNIVDGGGGYQAAYASTAERHVNNLYTKKKGAPFYEDGFGSGHVVETNRAAVYNNGPAGDFSAAPGSPLLTMAGADLSPERAELVVWFGASEVDAVFPFDIVGKAVSLLTPPVGPHTDTADAVDDL